MTNSFSENYSHLNNLHSRQQLIYNSWEANHLSKILDDIIYVLLYQQGSYSTDCKLIPETASRGSFLLSCSSFFLNICNILEKCHSTQVWNLEAPDEHIATLLSIYLIDTHVRVHQTFFSNRIHFVNSIN